jgi:hypothetical protein
VQAQLTALDLADEFFHGGFCFGDGLAVLIGQAIDQTRTDRSQRKERLLNDTPNKCIINPVVFMG